MLLRCSVPAMPLPAVAALGCSRIYIAGSEFVLVVLGMNPFIPTQGALPKTSMLTTVIGAVIALPSSTSSIFGFGLGVAGRGQCHGAQASGRGRGMDHPLSHRQKRPSCACADYLRPERNVILPVMALGTSTFVHAPREPAFHQQLSGSSLARYGGDVPWVP